MPRLAPDFLMRICRNCTLLLPVICLCLASCAKQELSNPAAKDAPKVEAKVEPKEEPALADLLQAATAQLREDLSANHFEGDGSRLNIERQL